MDPLDVNRITKLMTDLEGALERSGAAIVAQGVGISQTIHRAAQLHAETMKKASAASAEDAKRLTRATWGLVAATVFLAVVAAVHAYISATHG